MLTIRPYRDADVDALLEVMNDVIAVGEAFVYETPFSRADFADYLASHHAAFVAELNEKIVGGYVLREPTRTRVARGERDVSGLSGRPRAWRRSTVGKAFNC